MGWWARRGGGLGLALLLLAGCDQGPDHSRWERAQRESTEGGSPSVATAPERPASDNSSYDDDILSDTPPAWNPGGTPGEVPAEEGATGWRAGGGSSPKQPPAREEKIDLAALRQGEPLPGSEFNKLFPRQGEGWDIVYKQEKEGFALASLRRGGDEMAQLSITDLRSNPSAAEKYQQPERRIAGHPAVAIGSKGTGVLVAGRFQVQVRSVDERFDARQRQAWIEKFDLDALAALK